MGFYSAYGLDGTLKKFQIAGLNPSEEELKHINAYLFPQPKALDIGPQPSYLSDLWSAGKAGIGDLANAAGYIGGSTSLEDWGRQTGNQASLDMSNASNLAQAQGVTGGGGFRAAGLGLARTIPQLGASLGALYGAGEVLGAGALETAGSALLRAIPRLAGFAGRAAATEGISPALAAGKLVAGALTGSTVEGLITGGMDGSDAKYAVLEFAKSSPTEFKNSELGRKYLTQYAGDMGQAAQGAAEEIGRQVAWKTGLSTAALALPGAGLEAGLMRGAIGSGVRGAGRAAMLGAGQEAGEEWPQGFSEQIFQNQGLQQVGMPVGTFEGALKNANESAIIGGLAGGLGGGAAGYFGHDPSLAGRQQDALNNYFGNGVVSPGNSAGADVQSPQTSFTPRNRIKPVEYGNDLAILKPQVQSGEPNDIQPFSSAPGPSGVIAAQSGPVEYGGSFVSKEGPEGQRMVAGDQRRAPGMGGRSGVDAESSLEMPGTGTKVSSMVGSTRAFLHVPELGLKPFGRPDISAGDWGAIDSLSKPIHNLSTNIDPTIGWRIPGRLGPFAEHANQTPIASNNNPISAIGDNPTNSIASSIQHIPPTVINSPPSYQSLPIKQQSATMGKVEMAQPKGFISGTTSYAIGPGTTSIIDYAGQQESAPAPTVYVRPEEAASISGQKVSDNNDGTISATSNGEANLQAMRIPAPLEPARGLVPVRLHNPVEVNGFHVYEPEIGQPISSMFGSTEWRGQNGPVATETEMQKHATKLAKKAEALRPALAKALTEHLRGLNLPAKLQLVDSLEKGAHGSAEVIDHEPVIKLALSPVMGKSDAEILSHLRATLNHEIIHTLSNMGVWRPHERVVLERYVEKQGFIDATGKKHPFTWSHWASRQYKGLLPDDGIKEEAIAEAFKTWAGDHSLVPGSVGGLFRRAFEFIKRLGRAFTGSGAKNVFEDIFSGKMGGREEPQARILGNQAPKYSLPELYGAMKHSSSLTGNERIFDMTYAAAYDKIYAGLNKGYRATIGKFGGMPATLPEEPVYNAFRKLQARDIGLQQFVDNVQKLGIKLDSAVNPIISWTLSHTKTKNDIGFVSESLHEPAIKAMWGLGLGHKEINGIDNALKNMQAPVVREMVDGKGKPYQADSAQRMGEFFGGFKTGTEGQGVLEIFMQAQHAQERNAYLESKWGPGNPATGKAGWDRISQGSGITNEEAEAILKYFSGRTDYAKIVAVAEQMRDIIRDTHRVAHVGKLSSDWSQHPDALNFKFYVPLVGRADLDNTLSGSYGSLSTYGRETKRAFGRESLPTNVIQEIIRRSYQTIDRANHNAIMNDLADIIEQNPRLKDLAEIVKVAPQKPAMGSNGMFMEVPEDLTRDPMIALAKNLVVNAQGVEESVSRAIKFSPYISSNKSLASFLRGDDIQAPGDAHFLIKGLQQYNRLLSSVLIKWSPEFALGNVARDIGTALGNIQQYGIQPGPVLKDAALAIKSLMRHAFNPSYSDPFTGLYKQLDDLGGTSKGYGFSSVKDINKKIIELSKEPGKIKEWARWAGKNLEAYNTAFENATRVAVFKAMLDAGYDERAAAYASKTITIDFDQGGTMKNGMNALYLFYNASIQGTFGIFAAAARSPRVAKMMGSIAILGASMDQINRMISGEDDRGNNMYDQVQQYVKEHNLIFMIPGTGKMIKIPLPYGYNAVYNMGRNFSALMTGHQSLGKAMSSTFGQVVDGFNPLGGTGSWLNTFAPTVADPFIDLATNNNYANIPIYPEGSKFGPSVPKSQLYWNNTNSLYNLAAEILRVPGTGTDKLPGMGLEVSPNQIQYVVETLTGGLGMLANRLLGDAGSIISGQPGDIELGDIPMVRKFVGQAGGRAQKQAFYEMRDQWLQIDAEISDARKNGEPDRIRAVKDSHPDIWAHLRQFKALNNLRSSSIRAAKALQDNARVPESQKRDKIAMLNKRADDLMLQILALQKE